VIDALPRSGIPGDLSTLPGRRTGAAMPRDRSR
jgi:hypothetical protein